MAILLICIAFMLGFCAWEDYEAYGTWAEQTENETGTDWPDWDGE